MIGDETPGKGFADLGRRRVVWILLLVGLPVFLANYFGGRPGINGYDANFYYAYAATWATGASDLDHAYKSLRAKGNDPKVFDLQKRTATGRLYNFYPVGHALLHLPATLIGRVASRVVEGSADPYTTTCQLFYGLSCLLAAGVGLELIRREIARTHDESSAAFAILALAACSMLGFYWFIQPFHSHTSSLLACGAILAAFCRIEGHREAGPAAYAVLGLACGAAAMIRLQDVALVAFAVVAAWLAVRNPLPRADRAARLAALAAGGAAGFAPQLLHWRWRDGAWVVRQYSDYATFDWSNPQLGNLLFSWRHGLFSWHPVLLLALVGFNSWLLHRSRETHRRPLAGAALGAFCGLAWIGACFSIWWFGDSFGSRPFLSVLPLFALGLAELWTQTRGRKAARFLLVTGAILLAAWNSLLALAFQLRWIDRGAALDFEAVFRHLV